MLTDLEIDLILKDILINYDYDFTFYARDSLKRRIDRIYKFDKFEDFTEFRERLKDADYIEHFIDRVTVNVTEMFRDFKFFKELKTQVLPALEKRPAIRIWHAGCSTGEEVFSMAILLHEANLLHKSTLIGTDINHRVLAKAESGLFPVSLMQLYSKNYKLAGGEGDFSSYYTSHKEGDKFNDEFRSHIQFVRHNLSSDGFLNKFDLVVCRNVLIYFDRKLQERVFKLFDDSTGPQSYLALGEKETINFPPVQNKFKLIGKENIWKKEF